MSYFTLAFGIGLVGLGLYGRLGTGNTSVTSLIPAVFGLAYMTFGEGMRVLPKQRRLFLFLALILSLVAIAGSIKGAFQLPAIWNGEELFRENGSKITLPAVFAQVAMLMACIGYIAIGLPIYFRKPVEAKKTSE